MTYEEQRKQELIRYAKAKYTAKAVAQILGYRFPLQENFHNRYAIEIPNLDTKIYLHVCYRSDTHYTISSSEYGVDAIKTAIKKTPAQIAQDIKRRMINQITAAVLKREAGEQLKKSRRKAEAESCLKLARMFRKKMRYQNGSAYFYTSNGKIEVDHDSDDNLVCRLELKLSPSKAAFCLAGIAA